MPLYIDLHVDSSLTPEDVKQCHIADKEIQEKYGVRYLQVLLNQPQGYLFCLVEGPDKETCAKVHQEAHGNVACNVLEITESDFSSLLLGTQKNGQDFTINAEGVVDNGVRAILTINILGTPKEMELASVLAQELLVKSGGRNTESLESPFTFIFNTSTSAIDAAVEAKKQIKAQYPSVEIRQGITTGVPLEKEGNFFETARRLVNQFAFIVDNDMIAICADSKKMYHGGVNFAEHGVKSFTLNDEKLLAQLSGFLESSWAIADLTITAFAEALALSRSQLTRKLKLISKLSPNDLIREFRLRKAIQLMNDQDMNVAEVALAVGFNNPSYFTKCFRDRFGKSPKEFPSQD